ncbi:MAG: glutamate racemase [Thermaurantiacus sp.]
MGTDRPILFLDSGVGGLTVLRAVRRFLPAAPLAYCADTAGFPYGTKEEPEVSARVAGLLGRLAERLEPRLIVIACNTASTIALSFVRGVLGNVPIVGTVPAIKPAAERSRSRVIGVLGTPATVRQAYVDDLSLRFAADCRVLRHGAPALVDVAEAKLRGHAVDKRVVRAALDGLRIQTDGHAMDTVVLACTHFPLLLPELEEAATEVEVAGAPAFLDGSEGIARRVAHLLQHVVWPDTPPPGRLVTTGPVEALAMLRPALHGFGLQHVEGL